MIFFFITYGIGNTEGSTICYQFQGFFALSIYYLLEEIITLNMQTKVIMNAKRIYINVDVLLMLLIFEGIFSFFQHISGHIRTVPAYNRGFDNHFIVLHYWNITPQGTISCPVTLFWQRVNQFFALKYPLYAELLTRELQLPIWNLWWASQTRSERPNH